MTLSITVKPNEIAIINSQIPQVQQQMKIKRWLYFVFEKRLFKNLDFNFHLLFELIKIKNIYKSLRTGLCDCFT